MRTYRPRKNYIFVTQETEENTSKGGIIIADIALKKENKGQILAMGPDAPKEFKIGQWVAYCPHGGFLVTIGKERIIVLTEEYIAAIAEESTHAKT